MPACPSCEREIDGGVKFCPFCGANVEAVQSSGGDPYVGKLVAGKYQVERLLGEGGMGKVYKATQQPLDKPVVLKVLRQQLHGDASLVARFQREARAASRLSHPNSIQVTDFGQMEDGALYIAMEYLEGKDLGALLAETGPLPEDRIVHIMSQVLSALADAHDAHIIHRDLKPENIMVVPRRDDPDFVKVLDFGIAKIQDPADSPDAVALTQQGLVCGTPEYMSPEQARGEPLDPRSDLYAVGVILFQLACGKLPFWAETSVGIVTKHLVEQPPRPREINPALSPAFEAIILRCLSKDPAGRPASAEALKAELLALGGAAPKAPAGRRPGTQRMGAAAAPPTSPPAASGAAGSNAPPSSPPAAPEPAAGAGTGDPASPPAGDASTPAGAPPDPLRTPPPPQVDLPEVDAGTTGGVRGPGRAMIALVAVVAVGAAVAGGYALTTLGHGGDAEDAAQRAQGGAASGGAPAAPGRAQATGAAADPAASPGAGAAGEAKVAGTPDAPAAAAQGGGEAPGSAPAGNALGPPAKGGDPVAAPPRPSRHDAKTGGSTAPKPAPKMVRRDPARAAELKAQGKEAWAKQDFETALRLYHDAARADPRDAEAQRYLGMGYLTVGNEKAAARHLRRYLKLAPRARDRKMIEEMLRSMGG